MHPFFPHHSGSIEVHYRRFSQTKCRLVRVLIVSYSMVTSELGLGILSIPWYGFGSETARCTCSSRIKLDMATSDLQ